MLHWPRRIRRLMTSLLKYNCKLLIVAFFGAATDVRNFLTLCFRLKFQHLELVKSIAALVDVCSHGVAPAPAAAAAPVKRFVTNPYKTKVASGPTATAACSSKKPPRAVTPAVASAIKKKPAAGKKRSAAAMEDSSESDSDDSVIVLEDAMPPEALANPFAGKNVLHLRAVDLLYDLVLYRVNTDILSVDTKENRSRKGRVVSVRNRVIALTPKKDRKYLDPFKAPKEGLATFQERDTWLKKTAAVAEAGVIAINDERLPTKNRILRRKWLARKQANPRGVGAFKPITKHKIKITELSNLLDDTKQEWQQI